MPQNLQAAQPVGVLPQMLFTSWEESRIYPLLSQTYHDATFERSLIQDGVNAPESIRTWKLAARMTGANADTLRAFYQSHAGPAIPFYFYSPYEQSAGSPVGSNYDALGDNEQGRHVCRFTNPAWSEITDLALNNVSFELMEVA